MEIVPVALVAEYHGYILLRSGEHFGEMRQEWSSLVAAFVRLSQTMGRVSCGTRAMRP